MKSLKEWQVKEAFEDAQWQHIKSLRMPVDANLKGFIAPKIGRIQEAIVARLAEENPKVKSFRDIPPGMRDAFAKAILASTLELFYSSAEPMSSTAPVSAPAKPASPPPLLPQDEPQPPVGSKG